MNEDRIFWYALEIVLLACAVPLFFLTLAALPSGWPGSNISLTAVLMTLLAASALTTLGLVLCYLKNRSSVLLEVMRILLSFF